MQNESLQMDYRAFSYYNWISILQNRRASIVGNSIDANYYLHSNNTEQKQYEIKLHIMIEVFEHTNVNQTLQEFLNQLLQMGYEIISIMFINGDYIIPHYEIIAKNKQL